MVILLAASAVDLIDTTTKDVAFISLAETLELEKRQFIEDASEGPVQHDVSIIIETWATDDVIEKEEKFEDALEVLQIENMAEDSDDELEDELKAEDLDFMPWINVEQSENLEGNLAVGDEKKIELREGEKIGFVAGINAEESQKELEDDHLLDKEKSSRPTISSMLTFPLRAIMWPINTASAFCLNFCSAFDLFDG